MAGAAEFISSMPSATPSIMVTSRKSTPLPRSAAASRQLPAPPVAPRDQGTGGGEGQARPPRRAPPAPPAASSLAVITRSRRGTSANVVNAVRCDHSLGDRQDAQHRQETPAGTGRGEEVGEGLFARFGVHQQQCSDDAAAIRPMVTSSQRPARVSTSLRSSTAVSRAMRRRGCPAADLRTAAWRRSSDDAPGSVRGCRWRARRRSAAAGGQARGRVVPARRPRPGAVPARTAPAAASAISADGLRVGADQQCAFGAVAELQPARASARGSASGRRPAPGPAPASSSSLPPWPRPAAPPITTSRSATASTSRSRWEESSTVPPRSAKSRSSPRIQKMPSGSSPLAGSSRTRTPGIAEQRVRQAEPLAHAQRVRPDPARRAAAPSPTRSSSSSTPAPVDAHGLRRTAASASRPVRPACCAEASSSTPTAGPGWAAAGRARRRWSRYRRSAGSARRSSACVVDLPAPLGPRKPVTVPGSQRNDTSSTAGVPPVPFGEVLYRRSCGQPARPAGPRAAAVGRCVPRPRSTPGLDFGRMPVARRRPYHCDVIGAAASNTARCCRRRCWRPAGRRSPGAPVARDWLVDSLAFLLASAGRCSAPVDARRPRAGVRQPVLPVDAALDACSGCLPGALAAPALAGRLSRSRAAR